MIDQSLITEDMEIVGRDRKPVGTVTGFENGKIRLVDDGLAEHGGGLIDMTMIDFVEDGRLCLKVSASEVPMSQRAASAEEDKTVANEVDKGPSKDRPDTASTGDDESVMLGNGNGVQDRYSGSRNDPFAGMPSEVAAGDQIDGGSGGSDQSGWDGDRTNRARQGSGGRDLSDDESANKSHARLT